MGRTGGIIPDPVGLQDVSFPFVIVKITAAGDAPEYFTEIDRFAPRHFAGSIVKVADGTDVKAQLAAVKRECVIHVDLTVVKLLFFSDADNIMPQAAAFKESVSILLKNVSKVQLHNISP